MVWQTQFDWGPKFQHLGHFQRLGFTFTLHCVTRSKLIKKLIKKPVQGCEGAAPRTTDTKTSEENMNINRIGVVSGFSGCWISLLSLIKDGAIPPSSVFVWGLLIHNARLYCSLPAFVSGSLASTLHSNCTRLHFNQTEP